MREIGGMTIGELLDRVGSWEIAEWAVIFADEDRRIAGGAGDDV